MFGYDNLVRRVGIIYILIGAGIGVLVTVKLRALTITYAEMTRDFYRHVHSIDTVAAVYRLVHTFVTAAAAQGRVAPCKTGAGFQDSALDPLKTGVHVHHVDIDTVCTRVGHSNGIIQDSVLVNPRLTLVYRNHVSRT